MEAAFSTYTIIVMFICAVASTAAAGSYAITRNRMFMYVAIAFFLYFFDLSFIFQAEYLNHGTAITINALYELTSCGSISGHLVTIPYQIIKHIPTSALLEA